MMDCLKPETITRYREGALPQSGMAEEVESHLTECAACREAVRSAALASAPELGRALALGEEEPACLDEQTIARYVDGTADANDRELVAAHVESCRFCAEEVSAARAFRTQMETYDWGSARAIAESYARRPGAWWSWLGSRAPLRRLLVTAATLAAVAVLAVLLMPRPGRFTDSRQVATLQAELGATRQAQQAQAKQLDQAREIARQQAEKLRSADARIAQLGADAARLKGEKAALQESLRRGSRATNRPAASYTARRRIPNPTAQRTALRDGSGELIVGADGTVLRAQKVPAVVAQAVRQKRIQVPAQIAMLGGRGETLLGPSEEPGFAVIGPARTVVLESRPTFRWQPAPGANSYTVTVVDVESDTEAVSMSFTPARSEGMVEWTIPESMKPLRRGAIYRWYVTATLADGKTVQSPDSAGAPARFRVLDEAGAQKILRARRTYGDSPLTLGILYAQAGLMDEAERALRRAHDMSPGDATVRKLLGDVEGRR